MKLPQISQIHKTLSFLSIIGKVYTNYTFYGKDM